MYLTSEHGKWSLQVSYLQGAGSHAITGHYVCSTNCPVCRAASFVKRTSPVEPALHPFVNAPNVLSNAMKAADHPPLLERIQTSELSSSQTPREVPVIQEEWCAHSARKDIRTAQRSSSNNDKYRPPVVLSNPNDSRGFLQPAASARERHVGEWWVLSSNCTRCKRATVKRIRTWLPPISFPA